MALFETYLIVVAGILISVALPILRKYFPQRDAQIIGRNFWRVARPYVAVGAFSLLMAVVVVASLEDVLSLDWKVALITGIGWDSIWQRVFKGS